MIVSLRPLPQQCLLPTTPSRGVGAWGIHWGEGVSLPQLRPSGEGAVKGKSARELCSFSLSMKSNDFSSLSAKSQPKQLPPGHLGPRICSPLPSFLFSIHSVSDPRVLHAPLSIEPLPTPLVPNLAFPQDLRGSCRKAGTCPPNTFSDSFKIRARRVVGGFFCDGGGVSHKLSPSRVISGCPGPSPRTCSVFESSKDGEAGKSNR